MDEDAAESAMRQTAAFQEHVTRMFTPLKPGLAYVRTMEYAIEEFEGEMVEFEVISPFRTESPALLMRARNDAILSIDTLEDEIIDQIESNAIRFMNDPTMFNGQNFAWGATDADDMNTVLACFCDTNIKIWQEIYEPLYTASLQNDATLSDPERRIIGAYVRSFLGSATAKLPYCHEDGDEEIYYDSESTERDEEDVSGEVYSS